MGRGKQGTEGCHNPLRVMTHACHWLGHFGTKKNHQPLSTQFYLQQRDPGRSSVHGRGTFVQEKGPVVNVKLRQNILEESKTVTATSCPREGGCSRSHFSCGKSMLGAEPSKMSSIPLCPPPSTGRAPALLLQHRDFYWQRFVPEKSRRGVRVQLPLQGGHAQPPAPRRPPGAPALPTTPAAPGTAPGALPSSV